MRKNKKKRKSRSSRERGGYAIRNVPDAIGLLIKGISCRASGSWAENLFHRVLMSAEKRYQWGEERKKEGIGGGRLRSVDRGEKRIACNHADVVKDRLFNFADP